MNGEQVETVRRWFSALQQGDPAPELCDPEIEIRTWAEFPIPGPYHGHDGLQRWGDDVAEAFEEFQWALKSGEPIDEQRCLTVRDGKILSAVGYATPRRARRAAGLDPLP